jgi:hypothetical protein
MSNDLTPASRGLPPTLGNAKAKWLILANAALLLAFSVSQAQAGTSAICLVNLLTSDNVSSPTASSYADCSVDDATSIASASMLGVHLDTRQPFGPWANHADAIAATDQAFFLQGNSANDLVSVTAHLAVSVVMQQGYYPDLGVVQSGNTNFYLNVRGIGQDVYNEEYRGNWHTLNGYINSTVSYLTLPGLGLDDLPSNVTGGAMFAWTDILEIPLTVIDDFSFRVAANNAAWSFPEVASSNLFDALLLGFTTDAINPNNYGVLLSDGSRYPVGDAATTEFDNPFAHQAPAPPPALAVLLGLPLVVFFGQRRKLGERGQGNVARLNYRRFE